MRLDKWLWAARFYKTRSLASDDIAKGRVQVNSVVAKASRDVRLGDVIAMRISQNPGTLRTVVVRGVSGYRTAAALAQQMYSETPESQALLAAAAEQRRSGTEPALSQEHGRPTKRNRRDLAQAQHDWGDRWSASIDE